MNGRMDSLPPWEDDPQAIQDGGPAFPDPARADRKWSGPPRLGMSLRDYFAAKAMAAQYSDPKAARDQYPEDIAFVAYKVADAMLKARD
jgi:hypothetical protein